MAQVDYFLKLTDIPGESTDSKHKGEIDVKSWHWAQANKGSHSVGGGRGGGKVEMEDFVFTMSANKSSPKLFLACANGAHIKQGILLCRRAGKDPQEYYKITFSDVLVSSFQTGGSSEAMVPEDTIALTFGKIEFSYAPQKADGTLDAPVVHNYSPNTGSGA